MIDGINDTDADADALAELLRGEHAHVNLIPMNPSRTRPGRATPMPGIERFAARLRAAGIATTIRRQPRDRDRGGLRPARRRARGPARRRSSSSAAASGSWRRARGPARRALRRPGPGRGGGVSGGPSRRRRLRRPQGVLIAASILDCDLGALGDEIRRAEDAGADRIHLDVMDGHFVPNITFGWKTIEAVRRVTTIPFDAHLMISEPGRWTESFLDAGCDSITFHVEVEAGQVRPALERIREAGRAAGLSVKPGTPLAALDAYRDLLDIVLVMTVEPGFGGQSFMADVADAKLGRRAAVAGSGRRVPRSRSTAAARVETAEAIGRGGTDVIVAGSALYRAPDMAAEVERIRAIAGAARAADARRLDPRAGAAAAGDPRRGAGGRRARSRPSIAGSWCSWASGTATTTRPRTPSRAGSASCGSSRTRRGGRTGRCSTSAATASSSASSRSTRTRAAADGPGSPTPRRPSSRAGSGCGSRTGSGAGRRGRRSAGSGRRWPSSSSTTGRSRSGSTPPTADARLG